MCILEQLTDNQKTYVYISWEEDIWYLFHKNW